MAMSIRATLYLCVALALACSSTPEQSLPRSDVADPPALPAGDRPPPLSIARVAPADLLGTNGSAFFPIGLWYEGANRDAGHVGAAPEDPRDAEEYYEETLRQIRSFEINAFPDPNVDHGHAPALVTRAERVGLYVIHAPATAVALADNQTCTSTTEGQADIAIQKNDPSKG
jgi:hypothetical protein